MAQSHEAITFAQTEAMEGRAGEKTGAGISQDHKGASATNDERMMRRATRRERDRRATPKPKQFVVVQESSRSGRREVGD